MLSPFPLDKPTQQQLRNLAHILWSWPNEESCNSCTGCVDEGCSARRSKRLNPFFEIYKDLSASYEPDLSSGELPAIKSHEDLFQILEILQSMPDVPRSEFTIHAFQIKTTPTSEEERVVNLAVRIMFMINCSAQHQSFGLLEHGLDKAEWKNDSTLVQFLTDIFPTSDHPGINDEETSMPLDMKSSLMARKLKKVAGMKFRPTNDLRNHLRLEQKIGVVEIFHHTAFLKEHLRLTKDAPRDVSVGDCLKRGALPRQLALEVLDSIQKVLFPLHDPKSYSLLRSLTSTASFDPDVLRFESSSIRNSHEKDIPYLYFGARLADLYEEMENPRPRGWMYRWLERRSRERHVMMATVVGVVFVVLFGLASLGLGVWTGWVGWMQWQHPVSSGVVVT